ncbi:MAG: hypothetical protein IPK96_19205 [Flammeovirgaceae bacterium]|nr:hypothetical protein [Flammeovirgaceae bacterium]
MLAQASLVESFIKRNPKLHGRLSLVVGSHWSIPAGNDETVDDRYWIQEVSFKPKANSSAHSLSEDDQTRHSKFVNQLQSWFSKEEFESVLHDYFKPWLMTRVKLIS